VYERDMPDVPVIIDRYEDAVHIAEYEREHSRTPAQQADWLDAVAMRAGDVLGVDRRRVFVKNKHRQRGLTQHERVADERKTFVVHEGGLQFEVNLSDYVDTGLFLDHRLTRGMVREEAAGKRVLNLFCYTGSFTVYAASGGAEATTSVDLSNTYLEWAGRNLELNGLEWWGEDARANAAVPRAGHRLVRGDVMEWLREQRTVGERGSYDLAIVDPPTFSNSKRTDDVFDVQRDHAEMLGLVANLLSPKGVVYFNNNNRRFKLDEAGLVEAGYSGREISRRTVPPEYRNTRIHRCWRLVRGGGAEAGGVVQEKEVD
jgi:23S rRNA (guanine2445-N2)-methyltransferase / 23S rRNA (guanine2069-N7)-methyltransferase